MGELIQPILTDCSAAVLAFSGSILSSGSYRDRDVDGCAGREGWLVNMRGCGWLGSGSTPSRRILVLY
jgi:hypothetical protein